MQGAVSVWSHLVLLSSTAASLQLGRSSNPTQSHVLWSKSTGFFCCWSFLFFPLYNSSASRGRHPTIPESHLSKGLKSSLSENSSLCFILIAPPITNHISSVSTSGGMKNSLSLVTSLYVGILGPLALWSLFCLLFLRHCKLIFFAGGFLFFFGRRKIIRRGRRRKVGERRELRM